jgi:hypothetical protein
MIADAACALTTWMLVPFKGRGLSEGQSRFNFHLSSLRMAVEKTIGMIRGRFRRFRSATPHGDRAHFLELFVVAVGLHNWIKMHQLDDFDIFLNEYLDDEDGVDDIMRPHPDDIPLDCSAGAKLFRNRKIQQVMNHYETN